MIWRTVDYPDWWVASDEATPVRLETQCSTRTWSLQDEGQQPPHAGDCGKGIVACGSPELDLVAATGQAADAQVQCMRISNAERVLQLERELQLVVSCKPKISETMVDGETVNQDYLRASVVPYTIRVRQAPRNSLSARPPEFDASVCNAN
ncbi:hypothetical protein [Marinobacter fonticola]|uniref:hypothetical protein n=1 Tax=Marinobacter fonticola TaxID=2603215 RepID=UPI001D0DB123|nr:hypothetical protein [Marinobacter fonticola]